MGTQKFQTLRRKHSNIALVIRMLSKIKQVKETDKTQTFFTCSQIH